MNLKVRLPLAAWLLLVFSLVYASYVFSQTNISTENGYSVSPRGITRVLVVFAEADPTNSTTPFTCDPSAQEIWPPHCVPKDAGNFFDTSLLDPPVGFVTNFYHQMSFGAYRVLGNYHPSIVTIPMQKLLSASNGVSLVVQTLNSSLPVNYNLDAFDRWGLQPNVGEGRLKFDEPDGLIDVLLVLWRNWDPNNNRVAQPTDAIGTAVVPPGVQPGYEALVTTPLGNRTGFNNTGDFTAPRSRIFLGQLILGEFFHSLFGLNDWHTAGGVGASTVLIVPSSFSITGQAASTSVLATGWDRNHLGWKHPNKRQLISALDEELNEVVSDVSIASHPRGATFILRDAVKTGDAVRIRLPHVMWGQLGDPKNQYLWIENHQRKSEFDINARDFVDESGQRLACKATWKPGLYAYIQVGKDNKDRDADRNGVVNARDLYGLSAGSTLDNPNALSNWLFPLTAEGNYDFLYQLDQVTGPGNEPCQWGNISIPIKRSSSLPNPFTGFSDLYAKIDSDNLLTDLSTRRVTYLPFGPPFGDGNLWLGDQKTLLTDFRDGVVVRELPGFGDDEDAFTCPTAGCGSNRKILSLATNPAPVPIYTHQSFCGFGRCSAGAPLPSDNRTIWLNGLGIEILQEGILAGSGDDNSSAVKVRIRWDDYSIDRDVRWTGNLVLANDLADPMKRASRIELARGRTMTLDQGLSPTLVNSMQNDNVLVEPTVLTLESGTRTRIDSRARLLVRGESGPSGLHLGRGSTLIVRAGADLQLLGTASVVVERGAFICIEPGASIRMDGASQIVFMDGARAGFNPNLQRYNYLLPDPPSCRPLNQLAPDLDLDGDVDRDDLNVILSALNQPAQPGDLRDLDANGRITTRDAQLLTAQCSLPQCESGSHTFLVLGTIGSGDSTNAVNRYSPAGVFEQTLQTLSQVTTLPSTVDDLALGPEGHLYLVEGFYDFSGNLVRGINRYWAEDGSFFSFFVTLPGAQALTFGPDGLIYVSAGLPGDARIRRVGGPFAAHPGQLDPAFSLSTGSVIVDALRFGWDITGDGVPELYALVPAQSARASIRVYDGYQIMHDTALSPVQVLDAGAISPQGGNWTGMAFGTDPLSLFITDRASSSVLHFTVNTVTRSLSFAGTFSQGLALVFPNAITIGSDGNGDKASDLYISSGTVNDRVQRFDGKTGVLIDQFVTPRSGDIHFIRRLIFGSPVP